MSLVPPRRFRRRSPDASILLGVPFAKLTRREWLHPRFNTKYNALQRAAYFSVPVAGVLSIATGWAIHKPMQLHWLSALFVGFDATRVWHFWLIWLFIFFVVPHVILVFAEVLHVDGGAHNGK